jgi:hypothetical protein
MEYFWSACRKQGNPTRLSERDFTYPGLPPQTRETAILALCDAVEAASRTLKQPDERAIEGLIEHIVFTKLMSGQLDQSGLTPEELHKIGDSLVETLRNSFHVRVEYPWQREGLEEDSPATTSTGRFRLADVAAAEAAAVPAAAADGNGSARLAAAEPAPGETPVPATGTAQSPNGTVQYAYVTESAATVTTTEPVKSVEATKPEEPPRVASPVEPPSNPAGRGSGPPQPGS